MHYTKSIIAVIASANAIKLGLEANSQNILDDTWNTLAYIGWEGIDYVEKVGKNIGNSAVSLGYYIGKSDGLIDDIAYVGTADFGNDLLDIGESFFTGETFVGSWNWMSENQGQNWRAFGETTLNTSLDLLNGDIEGAWNRITNKDSYIYEDDDSGFIAYSNYIKEYQQELEALNQDKAKKAESCAGQSPRVGAKAKTYYDGKLEVNTTEDYAVQLGSATMSKFYQYFKGSPTRVECEEADCLHPCYGASHESNCNLCFQIAFDRETNDQFTTE